MGQAPGVTAAVRLAGAELGLIGVTVIVQRLRRIFGAMTAGDPFHPDNVRRLRVTALVLGADRDQPLPLRRASTTSCWASTRAAG